MPKGTHLGQGAHPIATNVMARLVQHGHTDGQARKQCGLVRIIGP